MKKDKEGNHMEEIEEVLSKDSRYHVLEVFSDNRADLLMAYLEELERDPQLNSLFSSHREAGDMARSHGMLEVMKQWVLPPSQETYLTLTRTLMAIITVSIKQRYIFR